MGMLLLGIAFTGEAVLGIREHISGKRSYKEKMYVRASGAAVILVLLLTGALDGAFRYGFLAAALLILSAAGFLKRRKAETVSLRKTTAGVIGSGCLYAAALLPAIVFPDSEMPRMTGGCQVATAEYTWVDESRREEFSDTGENRSVTVKFWYPQEEGSYPLAVFSHGAFGIIESNTSTCMELASNGYVAVSIGHPYHAMYVKDVNGRVTLADTDFVQQIFADNGTDDPAGEERVYNKSREWLALRVADENFVLDTIRKMTENGETGPFERIDSEKTGLFGHSLGGASSVQLGRERSDIDAVIDLEGTMFGEYIGFENGTEVYNREPYPVPLMDINSRRVYEEAKTLTGQGYVNFHVGENAAVFHEVVAEDAGHMNFTDLPLVSPVLADLLGTGSVDAKTCIENVNETVLRFFDYYLKGKGSPEMEAVIN